jgi:hypothetical protein
MTSPRLPLRSCDLLPFPTTQTPTSTTTITTTNNYYITNLYPYLIPLGSSIVKLWESPSETNKHKQYVEYHLFLLLKDTSTHKSGALLFVRETLEHKETDYIWFPISDSVIIDLQSSEENRALIIHLKEKLFYGCNNGIVLNGMTTLKLRGPVWDTIDSKPIAMSMEDLTRIASTLIWSGVSISSTMPSTIVNQTPFFESRKQISELLNTLEPLLGQIRAEMETVNSTMTSSSVSEYIGRVQEGLQYLSKTITWFHAWEEVWYLPLMYLTTGDRESHDGVEKIFSPSLPLMNKIYSLDRVARLSLREAIKYCNIYLSSSQTGVDMSSLMFTLLTLFTRTIDYFFQELDGPDAVLKLVFENLESTLELFQRYREKRKPFEDACVKIETCCITQQDQQNISWTGLNAILMQFLTRMTMVFTDVKKSANKLIDSEIIRDADTLVTTAEKYEIKVREVTEKMNRWTARMDLQLTNEELGSPQNFLEKGRCIHRKIQVIDVTSNQSVLLIVCDDHTGIAYKVKPTSEYPQQMYELREVFSHIPRNGHVHITWADTEYGEVSIMLKIGLKKIDIHGNSNQDETIRKFSTPSALKDAEVINNAVSLAMTHFTNNDRILKDFSRLPVPSMRRAGSVSKLMNFVRSFSRDGSSSSNNGQIKRPLSRSSGGSSNHLSTSSSSHHRVPSRNMMPSTPRNATSNSGNNLLLVKTEPNKRTQVMQMDGLFSPSVASTSTSASTSGSNIENNNNNNGNIVFPGSVRKMPVMPEIHMTGTPLKRDGGMI